MVQGAAGAVGVEPLAVSGSLRAGSLRARSRTEGPVSPSPLEDDGVNGRCDIPGEVQQLGPVTESTNKHQLTAFTHVPTFVARELSAAAPSLALMPSGQQPGPGNPKPGGHVQFSGTPDRIPGEVDGTPRGGALRGVAMGVAFAEGLGRSFGALSGYSTWQAPPSPEHTSRYTAASPMRRFQSGTARGMPSVTRQGPLCHLTPLERPQDVAQLRLEITLQHSNSIEKVSAAELIPFKAGETPFVNGREPSPAEVLDICGAPELRRGTYYVPSDLTDAAASGNREVVSGVLSSSPRDHPVVVQLFVLFPSLMRPPQWLRRDFTTVKKAFVRVDWQISRRTQFLLYCLRRLDMARSQNLSVWASKRRFAVGETFTLYGAEGRAEPTDRSYVLVLKFYERRNGPGPKSFVNLSREGPLPRPRGSANGAGPAVAGGGGGGEIDAAPFMVGSGRGGGGGADTPSFCAGVGGASFAAHMTQGKGRGYTRLEALQEVHQQLLRVQSSDGPGQMLLPESGDITWDSVLDHTLAMRDGGALRRLIESHYLDHLLKSQETVDRIEKVAIANNDPALMMLLYEHTAVEMDLRVLAFLVHCWAVQPLAGRAALGGGSPAVGALFDAANDELPDFFDGVDEGHNLAGRIEEFLVKYVLGRRNPLSVTAAILRAIDDEIAQHEENRRIMRLASTRFHSLHLAMLRRLNRYADVRNIRLVERILQPVEVPNNVNEVSPLQVAFDSCDLKFMTETLIELYVKVQWLGRELLALTAHEDPRALGATNPLLAYAVLKSMGFAGKGTMDPLVMAASRLWHMYVFTSNAFFNSPRGRWCMHVMFELVFLFLYQWQIMYPDMDTAQLRCVHLVFLGFIVGNLLDMAQFVHYRYGSLARIRRYLVDPWNALSLLVNGGLLVLTALKLAQDFGALAAYSSADAIHMCMATLAVFVWVRPLGTAVPVYPSLGPLLNTVARMVEEVIAFLFPMLIIMTGFGTMMTAIYQDLVPDYSNFASAMLQLFSSMLGNYDFTVFDNLTVAQQLYGIIVQVIFLVISAILLLNLLIAIIINRYRPQEVEAESQFKKAQIVSYYHTQVARNLVCSPFCLPQLLLQSVPLLPSGRRPKLSGSARGVTALGLVPLDGVVLPDDGSDRPTGAAEVPHLVFLMTLYPLMMVVCILLFVLYTPFAVIQFASKMYSRSLKQYGKRLERRRRSAQQRAKAFGGKHRTQAPDSAKKRGPEESQLPTSAAAAAASDVEAGGGASASAVDAAAAAGGASGDSKVVRAASSAALSASSSPAADAMKQYARLKKALQAELQQADVGLVQTAGYLLASSVLTVVGLFFYLTVLVVVMLVGWSSVYQWAAKLAFSLYNVLLRPLADALKARRRRQRVSPAAAAAAAALHVASGVGAEAATAGGGRGAVPMSGCGAGGRGALPGLFGGCRKDGAGVAATGDGGASADTSADVSTTTIGAAAAAGDESEQLHGHKSSKARLHWRHAIQRVIAMKNERYLTKRDVLKCLAASKFKPHMAGWNLRVDLRSSSQDILDSQMQDLEDDEDPWDDEQLMGGDEDDDTLESAILEKTEHVASMLKGGITAQQKAMADLAERVRELAEEVARLRAGGANGGGDFIGGGGDGDFIGGCGGAMAAAAETPPATVARPGPPPTRPPSLWGLVADPPRPRTGPQGGGRCEEEGMGPSDADADADAVLMGSGIRREPELWGDSEGTPPRRRLSMASSHGTERRSPAPPGPDGAEGAESAEAEASEPDTAVPPSGSAAVPPPPPPPQQQQPSDATQPRPARARAKTAPPRPAHLAAASPPAAGEPTPAPVPSLAFAEGDPGAPAASHPPPPAPARPPLAPGTRAVAAMASGASRTSGGSPAVSTRGSAKRTSSAGAGPGPRALHQQMTLDRLLNSSIEGSDRLLATIGTDREKAATGGPVAAAKSSFSRPTLEPIRSGDRVQAPAAPMAAAAAAPAGAASHSGGAPTPTPTPTPTPAAASADDGAPAVPGSAAAASPSSQP